MRGAFLFLFKIIIIITIIIILGGAMEGMWGMCLCKTVNQCVSDYVFS